VQLIGDQRQHPLTLHLGSVRPFPVMPAQLFQLVVQASQRVLLSNSVSVSDHPVVVTSRAR
jgi:hypothetical protein